MFAWSGACRHADRQVFRRWTISTRGHLAASGGVMECRAAGSSWREKPPRQSPFPRIEPFGSARGFLPLRPRLGRRAALKMQVQPNGAVTTHTYDPAHRLTEVTGPAGSTSYGYDAITSALSAAISHRRRHRFLIRTLPF